MWAYQRGFLSSKIHRFGLNEENYEDFMPDFDYYRLHPINGAYSKWIDDKMTLKYVLQPFNEYLPEYYFLLNDGKAIKLMDCPKNLESTIESIIYLLQEKGALALKLISGSRGVGFYKISYTNKMFYINQEESTQDQIVELLMSSERYLVTEYLVAHNDIRKSYPITPNALRLGVLNDKGNTDIFGAFIRFGTESSGLIEHAYAGGVFCGVDVLDGTLFNPKKYVGQKIVDIKEHPNTKVLIEGKIPHWDMIKDTVSEIGKYLPQLKYMGFDIIITDNGFKILEINSHQDLTNMQFYYPVTKNIELKSFFERMEK